MGISCWWWEIFDILREHFDYSTLIQEEWLVPFNNIHDNKVSRMGILFRSSSADELPKHTHKTVYSCSTNYKVETDKEGGGVGGGAPSTIHPPTQRGQPRRRALPYHPHLLHWLTINWARLEGCSSLVQSLVYSHPPWPTIIIIIIVLECTYDCRTRPEDLELAVWFTKQAAEAWGDGWMDRCKK